MAAISPLDRPRNRGTILDNHLIVISPFIFPFRRKKSLVDVIGYKTQNCRKATVGLIIHKAYHT